MSSPSKQRPSPLPPEAARLARAGDPAASLHFPEDFLWGAATASYQIEGSPLADGAGESIWHRFSHTPGKTERGETGDVACDHYRRWQDDVERMKELGLKAYRFSTAWPRVLPEGVGRVNPKGMDFYRRLVDALLAAGITPMITLFHWDYPQALWDRGGLLFRDSAAWFAEYAGQMFRALGDRVKLWLTLNEPEVFTDCGFRKGVHAPGLQDWQAMVTAGHHLLRGHGMAVQAFRAACPDGKIGVAYALGANLPENDTPEDLDAARRNGAYSRRMCDPILLGRYPKLFEEMFAGMFPKGYQDDLPLICQKTDLIGVNYYSQWRVTHDPSVPHLQSRGVPAYDSDDGKHSSPSGFGLGKLPKFSRRGAKLAPHGWEILPEGLHATLKWARDRFGDYEFFVTENGTAGLDDAFTREQELHDTYRIEYIRGHLRAAHRAIQEGIRLRGYMYWSFMDNLEWAAGYRVRCGLVHTDFKSQERTPKYSFRWYQGVIANNAVESTPQGGRTGGAGPLRGAGSPQISIETPMSRGE